MLPRTPFHGINQVQLTTNIRLQVRSSIYIAFSVTIHTWFLVAIETLWPAMLVNY